MQLLRDVVRDVVGIIFPGAFFILMVLWGLWCFAVTVGSETLLTDFLRDATFYSFTTLLILSYVAGQLLRLKRLEPVEKVCTERYRRAKCAQEKKKIETMRADFKKSTQDLDDMEQKYSAKEVDRERLTAAYVEHNETFGLWEEFPYPYILRGRKLSRYPQEYSKFFDTYHEEGLATTSSLFHFFKSAIYEYSPSFKEEVLRQESLVRLFSGLYHIVKIGIVTNFVVGCLHLVVIACHPGWSTRASCDVETSILIVVIALLGVGACVYTHREIINRLRLMRVKEVNLASDGFYLIWHRYPCVPFGPVRIGAASVIDQNRGGDRRRGQCLAADAAYGAAEG